MKRVTVMLFFVLALGTGALVLEACLSRKESRWPGLVLPGLTFLYSLVMALNVAAVDGGFPWGPLLAALIAGNIPTLILLAVYAASRERRRKLSQTEKMTLEDL